MSMDKDTKFEIYCFIILIIGLILWYFILDWMLRPMPCKFTAIGC